VPAATDSATILQAIIAHLNKKINPITRQLSTLKNACLQHETLNPEDRYNFLWGNPKYDHHLEDNTSKQYELFRNQREIAAFGGQYHYDANNRITPGSNPAHIEADQQFDLNVANIE
jgi:hypothetical protein